MPIQLPYKFLLGGLATVVGGLFAWTYMGAIHEYSHCVISWFSGVDDVCRVVFTSPGSSGDYRGWVSTNRPLYLWEHPLLYSLDLVNTFLVSVFAYLSLSKVWVGCRKWKNRCIEKRLLRVSKRKTRRGG